MKRYKKPEIEKSEIEIEDILLPSGIGIGSQAEGDFTGTNTDVWGDVFQ